jgi:steroid 5-alpha reductase family enzyme
MELPEHLQPKINFTRSFTLFYIATAYLVSVALAWTVNSLLIREQDPLKGFFCINTLASLFLWFWNRPFRFPFLMECYPMLAPVFYMVYWQSWIESTGAYHDPLPNLITFFLIGLWSIRKLAFWLRSWNIYRDAAARYVSVTKHPVAESFMYGFFHFLLMPASLAALYSSLKAVVQRETTLSLTDMVGLALGLAAVLWDSVAEQQKLLHESQHKMQVRWKQSGLWRWVRYPEHGGFLLFGVALLFFTDQPPGRLVLPLGGLAAYYLYLRVWIVPLCDRRWLKLRSDYQAYRRSRPPLLPIAFLRL